MADPRETDTDADTDADTDGRAGRYPVLALRGRLTREDVPRLCDRVAEALADGPAALVILDVAGLADPCPATLDALARMQLTARRKGGQVRLRGAGPGLRGLLAWTGLDTVLPAEPPGASAVEPVGQAEEREEVRRVEEGVDRGDPPL